MPRTPRQPTERLDALLVARGLAADVEQARRVIWAGEVLVNDELVDQPGAACPVNAEVRIRRGVRRYVTRGGEKLANALGRFGLDVRGRSVLDIGAAGGGFTDCLLQHGAAGVCAVEVGKGQLAQRLRLQSCVVDMGGRDVMTVHASELPAPPTLAVVDVTFRSLSEVLPHVLGLLTGEWEAVVLVKPLQEAGALGLGRDGDLQEAVLTRVLGQCAELHIPVRGLVPSDPPGPGGALEFFLHLGQPGADPDTLSQAMAAALTEGRELLTHRKRPGRSGQQRRKNWRAFRRRHGG